MTDHTLDAPDGFHLTWPGGECLTVKVYRNEVLVAVYHYGNGDVRYWTENKQGRKMIDAAIAFYKDHQNAIKIEEARLEENIVLAALGLPLLAARKS